MTKRQRMIYENYEASENRQLWDVYSSCSAKKRSAFDKCKRRCAELGANRFRIIGANSWSFSVGFEYPADDGHIVFVYITKNGEEQWDVC